MQRILVVELKNPQHDLTIDNRAQLDDYLNWFEAHYPNAILSGYLVGRTPGNLQSKRADVEIIPWTTVLHRSRTRNLELLAAMLLRTGTDAAHDARVTDAINLGGSEATALLDRLATEHAELAALMDEFKLTESPSAART